MSTSRTVTTSTIVILVIAAILAIIGALLPGTTETQQIETYDFNPDDHPAGTAKVVSRTSRDGLTIFGIDFRQPEYHLDVTFTVPASCQTRVETGGTWPIADLACAGPDHLVGTIGGTGRTALGDAIVSVRVDVAEDCYTAVRLGMDWPPPVPACSPST
jgi:hypothetical protein